MFNQNNPYLCSFKRKKKVKQLSETRKAQKDEGYEKETK